MLYASVPFTRSPLLRNFRGESQTDPLSVSRQLHVPTNLLTRRFSCARVRLETWRPLSSHNSNSFALLWSEYMSNSKLVTSVFFFITWIETFTSSPGQSRVHHSMNQTTWEIAASSFSFVLEIVSMWWCFMKCAEGCHVALWHCVLP